MITVYGIHSPHVYRLRATLIFKGLKFQHVSVNLSKRSQEFIDLSPVGKIPVLKDEDGTVVMSSMDLNVFGYADTEYGAKRDFVRSITDLYYNLKDEKKNLHKSALPLWSFMQEMLEEK